MAKNKRAEKIRKHLNSISELVNAGAGESGTENFIDLLSKALTPVKRSITCSHGQCLCLDAITALSYELDAITALSYELVGE